MREVVGEGEVMENQITQIRSVQYVLILYVTWHEMAKRGKERQNKKTEG